jgi:hypothetical protein
VEQRLLHKVYRREFLLHPRQRLRFPFPAQLRRPLLIRRFRRLNQPPQREARSRRSASHERRLSAALSNLPAVQTGISYE